MLKVTSIKNHTHTVGSLVAAGAVLELSTLIVSAGVGSLVGLEVGGLLGLVEGEVEGLVDGELDGA